MTPPLADPAPAVPPRAAPRPGNRDRIVLSVIVYLILVGAAAKLSGVWDDLLWDGGVAPPAKDAAEAVRLASEKDLPALEGADRLVIETIGKPGVIPATECGPDAAAEIRALLRPSSAAPPAAKPAPVLSWYRLTFYRGDRQARMLMVFPNGDWSFVRQPVPQPVGHDPELVEVIEKYTGGPAGKK